MSSRLRVVLAAAALALAVLGAIAYVARLNATGADEVAAGGSPIASIDLRSFLQNPAERDQRMLDTTFRRVEDAYYKPVDAQLLLDGERKALLDFLIQHNVKDAHLARSMATGDRTHDAMLLEQQLKEVKTTWPRVASGSAYTQAAISGMMSSLGDPYTTYLSKSEIDGLQESLQGGDFGGIGVYIVQDPRTGEVVVEPIEGNPAMHAGMKPGDVIDSVDGKSIRGMKLDAVEHMIRGRVGTVVSLSVHSHGTTNVHALHVTRAFIHVPSVKAKMEGGIEYVRLADFGTSSYDEVRSAMLAGKLHHARGYILDLRNNGGGLLESAVQISSLFIPSGTIVSTLDRSGERESKGAEHTSIGVAPLVLLVNKYTASSSEITSGAIQDYKVGTIIGTQTFGKGVVQSIYTMPDGSALKITTARYLTPLGRDINKRGITPDIVVSQPVDPPLIDTDRDRQLAAAKSYILTKVDK
ncbi:MAG TPA: S41 family peptidase [Candidatus Acidoferrales bacterium]|nr:S41 family peptidase [Candidatus Acidoferrales bacterium]